MIYCSPAEARTILDEWHVQLDPYSRLAAAMSGDRAGVAGSEQAFWVDAHACPVCGADILGGLGESGDTSDEMEAVCRNGHTISYAYDADGEASYVHV